MADDYDINPLDLSRVEGNYDIDPDLDGDAIDGSVEGDVHEALFDDVVDEVGLWPFDGSNIKDSPAIKKVGEITKAVVKSKVTMVVAGATALAFPPVGVPMVAGLAVASKALDVIDGIHGTPKQSAAMKVAVSNTHKIATAAAKQVPPRGTTMASMVNHHQAVMKLPMFKRKALHTINLLATAKILKDAHREGVAKGGAKPVFGRLIVDGKIVRGHFNRVA